MIIHKGEQFSLPFFITKDDDVISDNNVDGVRIKIADTLCEWPNGDLIYDSESQNWLFPLSEDQTLKWSSGMQMAQVAIKIGDNFIKTDNFKINIKESHISEKW